MGSMRISLTEYSIQNYLVRQHCAGEENNEPRSHPRWRYGAIYIIMVTCVMPRCQCRHTHARSEGWGSGSWHVGDTMVIKLHPKYTSLTICTTGLPALSWRVSATHNWFWNAPWRWHSRFKYLDPYASQRSSSSIKLWSFNFSRLNKTSCLSNFMPFDVPFLLEIVD